MWYGGWGNWQLNMYTAMRFDEMIAVLEKAFQLELKIVDDTTAFEAAAGR